MGSNWNNKFFIVERVIILPDLCERQMHACVDHYTVCNDFDSKENSVYYYFFQNHCQSQGYSITVWNTNSVTQGK